MKFCWILAAMTALTVFVDSPVEGKRVFLRPMTAREVYRVLHEAGREDAVPEGRVVTQGLAAMKGFALGITKGIGGSLLYDLATSNATTEFINNLNVTGLMSGFTLPEVTLPTFNLSALFSSTSSSSTGSKITYTTQEICFSSRAANEISDSDDDDDTPQGRQVDTVTSIATTPDTTDAGTVTTDNGTTDDTTTDDQTGTGTDSVTTTSTGSGESVNCIVIQKPTVSTSRKRRSPRQARRHQFPSVPRPHRNSSSE